MSQVTAQRQHRPARRAHVVIGICAGVALRIDEPALRHRLTLVGREVDLAVGDGGGTHVHEYWRGITAWRGESQWVRAQATVDAAKRRYLKAHPTGVDTDQADHAGLRHHERVRA